MTRRRSARLASGGGTPKQKQSLASYAVSKLSSLLERDETPNAQRSLNAMITAPVSKNAQRVPGAFESDESIVKTPPKGKGLIPEIGEMHPGKVHGSTAEEPDSGLRLGFKDARETQNTPTALVDHTPSKSAISPAAAGFDFKWNRQESDLSSEAQRIMESVREEASKIKQKLQWERDQQALKDEDGFPSAGHSGRKFATPRRMTGRFSDAHKAEFHKMDSIANHASAWKTKFPSTQTALKRTKSRAELLDNGPSNGQGNDGRLENQSPGKRIRMRLEDDVSASGPAKNKLEQPSARSVKDSASVYTTPTKTSQARANSVRSLGSTKIPGLHRPQSKIFQGSPPAPQTEGVHKYSAALARAGSIRSILHKPQPKFSDDPLKIAAGTHFPTPSRYPNIDQTPFDKTNGPLSLSPSPSLKRVGFRFSNKDGERGSAALSPSPVKPAAPANRHQTHLPRATDSAPVTYPKLKTASKGPLNSHPPTPGDFTFRSNNTVNFGPTTSGLTSPTIRRVRPSGIVSPVATIVEPVLPALAHGLPNKKRRRADSDGSDLENRIHYDNSPAKKARTSPVKPTVDTSKIGATARRRFGIFANNVKNATTAAVSGSIAGAKERKPVLSMSRLNMLARPKNRQ